jgi:hypothetical protein
MKQPERYLITMISLLLFVVAAVFVEVTIGEEVKHQYRGLSPEVQKKLATATTVS